MNSVDSERDVEAAASINGRNEQNGPAGNSNNRPCNGNEINACYLNGETSQDSDYRSEGSSESDDPIVTSNDVTGNENDETGSNQNVWQNGILTSGLLRSNAAWPLAEGSLRHRYDVDISQETSNSFENKSGNGSENSNDVEQCEESEDKGKFKFSLLTRDQKVILIATSITNLLSFLSLSILAPFFPLEADKKDVSGTISGWIFGIFALVQFLTSPVFGRLLPVVGCKFMYIAGLFVACICTFLFGLLDLVPFQDGVVTYVSLCFLVRIMLALGCTAINNAGFVILVKAFPDNVATVFGIGEIFTGIGMVTGPAMGGFLYAAGGFVLPFAVIGGCCLVAMPIIWLTLPPQDDTVDEEGDHLSTSKLVLHPKSLVNSVVVVVAASIWAILDPTLEPHLRVYDLGTEMVGILFLIMAAFYSVTSPIWGTLADRMPDNRTLLIPGFIVAAAGLLLLGPSPVLGFQLDYNELWLTIISLIILGVASSLVVIPTYDIYIDILDEIGYPEDTRTYGMVSGLWVSMYALGDFAGPSLGGFLFEEIGFEWMATWVAGFCLATGALVAVSWLIEAKCCKKSLTEDGYQTERTPLLSSSSTHFNSISVDRDVLKTYPPRKEHQEVTSTSAF